MPEKKQRKRFPKISPAAFQHPMDQKALDAVKRAKGVDFLIRKVMEYGYERYLYINNIADNVLVSRHQCPLVYDMLVEACEILDVDLPQLYLDQNPTVNAYTFGSERPFIVLNSGLIDLLSEDELFNVICHEVGHIKCGHPLYKMVADFLRVAAGMIADITMGIGKLITGPIQLAFFEWDRKSELSADRAGLVGVQNVDVATTTLMKLAGGCSKVFEQFDKDQFLKQADSYRELDESMLNQFYKFLQVVGRTHPFPALRAREIDEWSRSIEYQNIMNGIYPRIDMQFYQSPSAGGYQPPAGGYQSPTRPPDRPYSPGGGAAAFASCPNCDASVEAGSSFCHICGSTIIGAIAVIEKSGDAPQSAAPPNATPNPPSPPPRDNTRRCRNCSTALKSSDDYCPSCGLNARIDW